MSKFQVYSFCGGVHASEIKIEGQAHASEAFKYLSSESLVSQLLPYFRILLDALRNAYLDLRKSKNLYKVEPITKYTYI